MFLRLFLLPLFTLGTMDSSQALRAVVPSTPLPGNRGARFRPEGPGSAPGPPLPSPSAAPN